MSAKKHTVALSKVEHVPAVLRSFPRWCTWHEGARKGGKPTKVPDVSTADESAWLPWPAVRQLPRTRQQGIGFIFTDKVKVQKDGRTAFLIGLDLDACRDPETGQLSPWAQDVVWNTGNSFTEITPSGCGLRVYLAVRTLPTDLASVKVRVMQPGIPGIDKKPEVQIFGLGPAQYTTVSGVHMEGTAKGLRVLDDLEWLVTMFSMKRGVLYSRVELPIRDPVEWEAIDAVIEQDETSAALARAEWQKVMPEKSASEAFHSLVCRVLQAAGGDGPSARDYLIDHTDWGRGLVHESADPLKYTRADWVEKDIARAAAKTGAAITVSDVFDDLGPLDPSENGQIAGRKEHRWSRTTLDELLDTTLAPWVVQHFFRRGQLGFVIAFPTVGKSTLVAAWIMSVLYDRDWCGKKTRGGSVVALVGEGRRGFANRLDGYRRHHGLGDPPDGRYLELVDFKVPLSGAEGQTAIKDLVAQITRERGHAPALVVIDTLSSHWAASEDSAEFGAPAMRALGDVAAKLNCAIVVVHHTTKGKGTNAMPELADLRGSGAFIGNSDFIYAMCSSGEETAAVGALKVKDDEPPESIEVQRVSVDLGREQDGEPVTAAVFDGDTFELLSRRRMNESARDAASDELIREAIRAVRTLSVEAPVRSADTIGKAIGVRQSEARAAVDMAVARGFLVQQGSNRRDKNYGYVVTDEGLNFEIVFDDLGDLDA